MRKSAQKSHKFYYLVLGILLFGVLLVYDASPLYAQRLVKDPYHFAKLQALWALVGFLFFVAVGFLSLNYIKTIARGLFVISLLFLIFLAGCSVFFPCSKFEGGPSDIAFCPCKNGARRWVNLNPPPLPQFPLIGTFGFQATDLAKLAVVLYLPLLLESKMKSFKHKYEPFYYIFGYCGLVSGLVLAQPNMSNSALIVIIGVCIYFISGLDLKPLFYALPALFVLGLIFILISPYRRARLESVVKPHEQSALGGLYQSEQILIGLGAGGPFGVGVGQSVQKHSYTPELIGDSIFAIIGEEMGFMGSLLFIAVFGYFSYTMVIIVSNSVTLYEKMMGTGVIAWIFFQYVINLYSTIKLITPTGIPIPFISYGGSSMVFALVGLGLVSNIYRRQDS